METLCRFYLLGRVEMARPGLPTGRLRRFPLREYLALRFGETITREEIIGALWAEKSPDAVRGFLNSTLHHLRKQLEPEGIPAGAILLSHDGAISLNPRTVWVDAAEFMRQLTNAERNADPVKRRERLEQAVGLYRGPLLPGCAEEWADNARTIYEAAFFRAACELLPAFLREGREQAAAKLAERILLIEPLCIEAHTALLQSVAGQKAVFDVRWRRARKAFADEGLGLPPSLLTLRAARRQATPPVVSDEQERAPQNVLSADTSSAFLDAFFHQPEEKQRRQAREEPGNLRVAMEAEIDKARRRLSEKRGETDAAANGDGLNRAISLLSEFRSFSENETLAEICYQLWERLYQALADQPDNKYKSERLTICFELATQAMTHGNNRRLTFWQTELERNAPRWLPDLDEPTATDKVGVLLKYTDFYHRIAQNAHYLGQNAPARRYFEEALRLLTLLPDAATRSREIEIRANYHYTLQFAGDYAGGRRSLERAGDLLHQQRRNESPPYPSLYHYAECLYLLAQDDCRVGDFRAALNHLDAAILIYDELPSTSEIEHSAANCRRQLAAIFLMQGRYGLAQGVLQAADAFYARLHKPHSRAAVSLVAGNIFLARGRFHEAEARFSAALAFWRDQQNHPRWTGLTLTGLAETRLLGGNTVAAGYLAAEALARFADAPSPLAQAQGLLIVASAARRGGAFDAAIAPLRDCLAIRQEAENRPNLPAVWEEIAALLFDRGSASAPIHFLLAAARYERRRLEMPVPPVREKALEKLWISVAHAEECIFLSDDFESRYVTEKAFSYLNTSA